MKWLIDAIDPYTIIASWFGFISLVNIFFVNSSVVKNLKSFKLNSLFIKNYPPDPMIAKIILLLIIIIYYPGFFKSLGAFKLILVKIKFVANSQIYISEDSLPSGFYGLNFL